MTHNSYHSSTNFWKLYSVINLFYPLKHINIIINHSTIDQNTCNLQALVTPQALSQNEDTDLTGTTGKNHPLKSDYSKNRQANIAKNKELLASLGLGCDDKSDVCFRTGSALVTANAAATNGLDGPDMANDLTNPTVTATNPKASTADDTLTNPTATNPIATPT